MFEKVNSIGITERKERDKQEMREKILQAADQLVKEDGISGISIRRIADRIEYSPAVIYHYYRDKEEIVNQLVERNYRRLIGLLSSQNPHGETPEQRLREKLAEYIRFACGMPDEYKAIMLSESPQILVRTSVLGRGAAESRPAVGMLCRGLSEISPGQSPGDLELQAQVIWAALYGLTLRLITEKVGEEQQNRLVDGFLDFVLSAVRAENKNIKGESL